MKGEGIMAEKKAIVFSKLYVKRENGKDVPYAKLGLKNADGKEILDAIYDNIGPFVEDFAIVKKDKKYGVVKQNGKFLFEVKYDKIESQSTPLGKFVFIKNSDCVLPEHGKIALFANGKCEKYVLPLNLYNRQM